MRIMPIFIVISWISSACGMTLNDLQTGTTVSGPALTTKDMQGKVVLVEYWGTRCGPCIALMPKLAELYTKYMDQGLHIIGLECQGSSAEQIKKLAESKGTTYQITTNGNLKGSKVSGIPHAFLFAPDGRLVEQGHIPSSALENKIKPLLLEAAAAMAGPGPYTKLAGLAAQVKAQQGLGQVLKTLRARKNSSDLEEAREANMMFDSLGGVAQQRLDKAIALKGSDPAIGIKQLDALATQFSGDEIADTARQTAIEWKREPQIQQELQALDIWTRIETMQSTLKPYQGSKNPGDANFKKLNQAAIVQILQGCDMLTQRYPNTVAANKASALASQYR